jgi:Zn-finger nucleic acid-binding protein
MPGHPPARQGLRTDLNPAQLSNPFLALPSFTDAHEPTTADLAASDRAAFEIDYGLPRARRAPEEDSMTEEFTKGSQTQASAPAKGVRKYFTFAPDFALRSAPLREWVNENEQMKGFRPASSKPFGGIDFSEPPQIRFDRKGRRGTVIDASPITLGIWLVSDRLKALFERLDPDPQAFSFQRAQVDYSNFPEPGPGFWFCYFMRELDCVDEERSDLRYYDNAPGIKAYRALVDVKMRPEVIGSARAFRLTFADLTEIVDDVIVDAIKAEKIRGFEFTPIQK